MRAIARAATWIVTLALAAGCDGGFGLGIDVDPGCAAGATKVRIATVAQPSGKSDGATVAAKDFFLRSGMGRVVIIPPDGTSAIEVTVVLSDDTRDLGSAMLAIPIQGHQLIEQSLTIKQCVATDAGARDAFAGVDAALPDMAAHCTQGSCTATPATPICDGVTGRCVGCLVDGDCGDGTVCQSKQCVPGCNPGHPCNDAGTCLQSMCARCTQKSDCGGQTPFCDTQSGLCVGCRDVNDCPMNTSCVPTGGGRQCAPNCINSGDCKVQGQLCCSMSCIDTLGDPNHCGGCLDVCPLGANVAAAGCMAGTCTIAGCNMPFADCDHAIGNGCETNVGSDAMNCSGCGIACMVTNGTGACSNQMCKVGGCDAGFADCNGLLVDGCEANLLNDANTCGACNTPCQVTHGTPRCSSGTCQILGCDPGYRDCNNKVSDGCETAVSGDPINCGSCGNVCPGAPNADPSCAGGNCTLVCHPGYKDCNGSPNDGCEIHTDSDPLHCGTCATTVCDTCTAGLCGLNGGPDGGGMCDPTQCAVDVEPMLMQKFIVCHNPLNNGIQVGGVIAGEAFYTNAVCACLGRGMTTTISSELAECITGGCPSTKGPMGVLPSCVDKGDGKGPRCDPGQGRFLVWVCQ